MQEKHVEAVAEENIIPQEVQVKEPEEKVIESPEQVDQAMKDSNEHEAIKPDIVEQEAPVIQTQVEKSKELEAESKHIEEEKPQIAILSPVKHQTQTLPTSLFGQG